MTDEEFETELMHSAQKISLMPQNAQRELKKIMITGLREDIEKAFKMEAQAAERSTLDQESMDRVSQKQNKKIVFLGVSGRISVQNKNVLENQHTILKFPSIINTMRHRIGVINVKTQDGIDL